MDRRLVQTAVVDSADSEDPVILPEDHRDLDEFRRFYWGRTFWCGTLLGGCGRELTTKRYSDRVCHFAHIADADEGPSECSRGVESADHLYIKRAMQSWLADLGRRYTGTLLGDRHDEAIEFTEPGTNSRLRIQLAHMDPADWRKLRSEADETYQRVHWILRGNHRLLDQIVEHEGHALSVECETVGTAIPAREVRIRTRDRLGHTDWIPLTQCELSDEGAVTTPSRDESEPSMTAPSEMRLPLLPERIRFTLASDRPTTSTATGRATYRVHLMAGGTQRPALLSLPAEALQPERHQTYQLIRAASIVLPATGANPEMWRIDAEDVRLTSKSQTISQINELNAPKSRAPLPDTSIDGEVRVPSIQPAPTAYRATAGRQSARRYLENAAEVIERALLRAASIRQRITWSDLATILRDRLSIERLEDSERISILSIIERRRPADSPLLSVVLIEKNPDVPLPYLAHVDRVRDLIPRNSDHELTMWCHREFERTHEAYSTLEDPLIRWEWELLYHQAPPEITIANTLSRSPVPDIDTKQYDTREATDSALMTKPVPCSFGSYTEQEVESITAQIRNELIRCARSKVTPTWRAVCERVGRPELESMKTRTLGKFLAWADMATPSNQPLLSTVLAVGDPARLYYIPSSWGSGSPRRR